jgi:hypothetical protein
MSVRDETRCAAIQSLPAFPRALFLLHNFYDVGADTMAEMLAADRAGILACLAEARALIHRHQCYASAARFDPTNEGVLIAPLEQRLRREYRAMLETAFAECGYAGAVAWPNPSADIAIDEEAAAAFVLPFLADDLRKAVAGSCRPNTAMVDLWCFVLPWRRIMRDRLLLVTSELHCSGWEPFDIWLANRIAPERHYPGGYVEYRRLRRPLPEEMGEWLLPHWPEDAERQRRFDSLPRLTQDVYALFHCYGRNSPEIAKRLPITRRSVKRRMHRAIYIMCGWRLPSIFETLGFELNLRWERLRRQGRGIWTVLRD